MKILVTGSAGFIGFHLARRLLAAGHSVVGLDGMTAYYDVRLKERRVALLNQNPDFIQHVVMLEDMESMAAVVREARPDAIFHLAAQAGVRYSLENPRAYVDANLVGTFNVLELARELAVKHLLMASTSSVYGANTVMPFTEDQRADMPMTLYAATKRATEHMAHSYAHLWGIPTTMLRFFTVYGPWGRPDMALFKFAKAILDGEPIDIYGQGAMRRDFTYVTDLVEAMARLLDAVPAAAADEDEAKLTGASIAAPFRVVNIAGGQPVELMDYIACLERHLGRQAQRNYMPMQQGDVPATFANADLLERLTGYRPSTTVDQGVKAFVDWYVNEWR
ncbi:UDP-glucuronate 5'-epimerase [Alsobacter metallidurans]|uniref:UDP-glucuronate 5'-epimerase n=1 Tax=Alsobacter metallidurans TaxID=340221 RepID=A0A917I686_9HYPH|nr:SDR family NAD(P)-dependent oxidoreductase [Alsobacter metallidurans]GGH15629.1 UDP-glucuronate 5'-epimerase [Alsobacter metallidurans]